MRALAGVLLFFALKSFLARAAPISIENEFLRVTYDDVKHEFQIARLPDGKVFVTAGPAPVLSAGVYPIMGRDGSPLPSLTCSAAS